MSKTNIYIYIFLTMKKIIYIYIIYEPKAILIPRNPKKPDSIRSVYLDGYSSTVCWVAQPVACGVTSGSVETH